MKEKTLQERLLIKAGIMENGEKIAWGSDTALMREAANEIEQLEKIIEAMTDKLKRVAAIEFQIGEEI